MKINLKGLNEAAGEALRSFESAVGIKLARDDNVTIWVFLEERDGEYRVRSADVNTLNSSPEGVDCEAGDLDTIEDWFVESWCYVYDYDAREWVSVPRYMNEHSEAA